MTKPIQQPRVAIRAVLQAAGLITEVGEVRGAEADRPDARLLALIAKHELIWGVYEAMFRKPGKQKFELSIRRSWHEAADAIMGQIHGIPAITPAGVVAKAELVLAHVPYGHNRGAMSAIADALRASKPRASPVSRRKRCAKGAAPTFVAPDDEPLLQLIADYTHVRKLARVDEECEENIRPDRFAWAKTYLKIRDDLVATPALTGPGIAAKLEATMPTLESCRRWPQDALVRSVMNDLLEVGL